jgi:transcriptional regulator with XRE-family HTH domain
MRDHGRAIRSRVGRTIRRLRLARDLSQERLAERAGNSWKHVGQIERGEVNVGLDVLAGIAGALSVDIADLFVEPRGGRPASAAAYVITGDELRQIEHVLRRIRSLRVRRSTRASD